MSNRDEAAKLKTQGAASKQKKWSLMRVKLDFSRIYRKTEFCCRITKNDFFMKPKINAHIRVKRQTE